jgi:hypothetical protein
MKCREFEQQLQSCIEQRLCLTGTMEKHVARCGRCESLWQEQQFLDRTIVDWIADIPSVSLSTARLDWNVPVVAIEDAPPNPQRLSGPRRCVSERPMIQVLALTAGVLLMMVPAIRRPAGVDPVPVSLSSLSMQTGRDEPSRVESLDSLLRNVSDAYLVLAEETLSPVSEFVPFQSLRGDRQQVAVAEFHETETTALEWQRGIEPIQRDVEQAVGFLLHVVTPSTEPPL